MKRMGLASIILVLGLMGNGFSEGVTNRQILEKLEKIETKINDMNVRIARVETKVEEGQKSLQQQINGLDKRIDNVWNLLLWGFGIIFTGIFALIGFVLWDRRTALAPAVRKMEALEERERSLEKALKEFSQKEPKLVEAFKHAGIL